jgi:hypothetical protein
VCYVAYHVTNNYCNTIHSVLLISDTPYGVTLEDWDKVWTKADILTILKQFVACNKAQEWSVAFWHTPQQTAVFLEALSEMGYTEPTHLCWHKTAHTSQTPVAMHTSSWEMLTLAFFPARQKNSVNLARDPRFRHNFIEYPAESKKFKDANGVVAIILAKNQRRLQNGLFHLCVCQVVLYWLSALELVEGRLLELF